MPNLLGDVVEHLERAEIRVALIGAVALTVYGVARATFDADLLTTDRRVLGHVLAEIDQPVIAEVESRLPSLPQDSRELWTRIRASS